MFAFQALFFCAFGSSSLHGVALQVLTPNDIEPLPTLSLTDLRKRWPYVHRRRATSGKAQNISKAGTGRLRYIAVKLEKDKRSLDSMDIEKALSATPADASLLDSATESKKVAFMFMLMDELDWPKVWDRFFADAKKHRYSIYIHRANATSSSKDLKLVSHWGATVVPRVENSWCALMGVEVALIIAALQDPLNAQFVLVSHDSIPLKAFGYIYKQLAIKSPDDSKFCLADRAKKGRTYVKEEVVNEIARSCVYRDFYTNVNPRTPKHHQWIVLARRHATTVARRAQDSLRRWSVTWRHTAPDLQNMGEGCSDEAVPLAALLLDLEHSGNSTGNTSLDLERIGVKQECTTMVQWHNCFRGTELTLPSGEEMTRAEEVLFFFRHIQGIMRFLEPGDYDWLQSPFKLLTNEFPHSFSNTTLQYLGKLVQHGFMFARKFPPGLQVIKEGGESVLLGDVLPDLWEQVDEQLAEQRVWTRTSFAGAPSNKKTSLARIPIKMASSGL